MHTGLVCFADVCHTLVGMWHQLIDKCRFAHAAVAAEQCNLSLQQGPQLLYTLSCRGGDGPALVADGLVEVNHHLLVVPLVVREQVALVKDKNHGYAVGFGRCQEAVDERR